MRHWNDLRKQAHYFVLIGVSCVVVYAMERKLSEFRQNVEYSTSEREYLQKLQHKQIMDSLVPYDGQSVPLERNQEELPKYRHED
jgi:hypothetical protein